MILPTYLCLIDLPNNYSCMCARCVTIDSVEILTPSPAGVCLNESCKKGYENNKCVCDDM